MLKKYLSLLLSHQTGEISCSFFLIICAGRSGLSTLLMISASNEYFAELATF